MTVYGCQPTNNQHGRVRVQVVENIGVAVYGHRWPGKRYGRVRVPSARNSAIRSMAADRVRSSCEPQTIVVGRVRDSEKTTLKQQGSTDQQNEICKFGSQILQKWPYFLILNRWYIRVENEKKE